MRIVNLRPLLSAFIHAEAATAEADRPTEDILTYRYAHQAALLCIKLAQDAIDMIFDRLSEDPAEDPCLSEWWYNIMYIYAAGTVLVAAQVMPDLVEDQLTRPLAESWARIRHVFKIYQTRRNNILRLLAMLELLYHRVPEQYDALKQEHARARTSINLGNEPAIPTNVGRGERQFSAESMASTKHGTNATMRDSTLPGSSELQNFDVLDALFDPNDMSWLNDLPMWDD